MKKQRFEVRTVTDGENLASKCLVVYDLSSPLRYGLFVSSARKKPFDAYIMSRPFTDPEALPERDWFQSYLHLLKAEALKEMYSKEPNEINSIGIIIRDDEENPIWGVYRDTLLLEGFRPFAAKFYSEYNIRERCVEKCWINFLDKTGKIRINNGESLL